MQNSDMELEALARAASRIDADDCLGRGEILTPPIRQLSTDIVKAIHVGLAGYAVYGPRRAGKTWALRYLQSTLSAALGYEVLCVHWIFPERGGSVSPLSLVKISLKGSGCEQSSRRDLVDLENRLVTHLTDSMVMRRARRLVVLIDEAQVLDMNNYLHLVYLYNLFEDAKLSPFFVFVGQPELSSMVNDWKAAKAHHVTGRFFLKEHLFTCVAHADFEEVLEAFDEPVTPGGDSPVAPFLKQAYACGWSLKCAAPYFREALQTLTVEQKIGRVIPLPMSFFRLCTASMIRRMAEFPFRPDLVTGAMILECLMEYGFPSRIFEYVPAKPVAPAA